MKRSLKFGNLKSYYNIIKSIKMYLNIGMKKNMVVKSSISKFLVNKLRHKRHKIEFINALNFQQTFDIP